MSKKVSFLLLFVMLASTFLAACGPPQTVEKVVTQVVAGPTSVIKETSEVIVKETSEVIVEPTKEPVTRKGAWVDQVIMIEEPNTAAGVTRLESGELDVYAYTIADRELFKRVRENPDLAYALSYGSYNEITFNPSGPVFTATNKLNPFAIAKVREAMNWLVDRDYIVQEIMGGLGAARFTCLNTTFPDYAKYADVARGIELKYAYNPEKAKEIIDAEMTNLGATMEGGKWMYNGEPVTLIFLIRTEDERRAMGDYISTQLESIGFTVDRQYKKSSEASPIWARGDPRDGQWHLYTGGWISTVISRDISDNFSFFYTDQQYPIPLFQAYVNDPEFYDIAQKLWVKDFTTLAQRDEMMARALELAMYDSNRVWLVDRTAFAPYRANIKVAADLAGSIYGGALWAQTLRREGEVGGAVTIATTGLFTDPWNPIAGSNWIYDRFPQRGTSDAAFIPDPYTGLYWPQRAEKMECVVQDGLPVGTTLDWVTVEFAPSIEVPTDAWSDWDAANQKFITAGERFTETATALAKCTVYYPADMFQTVQWHDGSPLSVADFVMTMIMTFDQGKADSPIYDEAQVPNVESFLTHFKGVRILSTDPLVIETYDDSWYLDAEYMFTSWFPSFTYGPAAWHDLVPGILAETDQQLAFSADKSTALEIEWANYIAGPSIDILSTYLVSATAETYIPYAPTMGEFVTADEAAARYANLGEWVRTKGHFWVGTGPFYLERGFPLEKTVLLKRNLDYPDMADRWLGFSEPMVAVVEVAGSESVTIGKEATFDVYVTFKDAPYPTADIDQVKYLVLDAKGVLAGTGVAEVVTDGEWVVTIPADVTSQLEAGSNRLEVIVVPTVVSMPSFGAMQFVTAP
jgi:peptide/nickel transport system substrate-binding protein